jgi:hypothetical protein
MEEDMTQFKVGTTYSCRSICDYECIWEFTVISRTDKTIVVTQEGVAGAKSLRINAKLSEHNGAETVFPLGRYSMAPTLVAK